MLELAHQYDLSTNALAEAKARLSAIRPFKERLIGYLNGFDKSIVPRLKNGTTRFDFPNTQVVALVELDMLLKEPEAAKYVSATAHDRGNFNNGKVVDLTLILDPALLKP